MHVLSVIHYGGFGGPPNRNLHVAKLLYEHGIRTTVLLPDEPGSAADRLRAGGVSVIQMPLRRLRVTRHIPTHLRFLRDFWRDVTRLREIIHDQRVDVVQINGLVNPHGAIAAKLEGVPVVWQILDTFNPMLLRRAFMPFVNRLSDVLMCTGVRVAREHPGAMTWGDRLICFFPPVDLARFRSSPERRAAARKDLGIPGNALVVGNVGNVNLQKGHITFVRAAAQLRRRLTNVRFVILGATHSNHAHYVGRLWQEAERLGLRMGEDLIHRDPEHRVAELLPAFDVFWMTSEPRSEGISTAVEEAMAVGLPVITTDVGSMAEIVLDRQTGHVVPPRDPAAFVGATLPLLDGPYAAVLRESMGKNAINFAQTNFSAQSCAELHLRAYALALGKTVRELQTCEIEMNATHEPRDVSKLST
jgi:glycosyltransferase involved in cell wall biosynthesis